MRVFVSFCIFSVVLGNWVTVANSQYTEEWNSGNLGYGGGGYASCDIDDDGVIEISIYSSGKFAFYNGDAGYSLEWELFASPYDYIRVNYQSPKDTDGDGVKEVVVYRYSYNPSRGKIYVYDSQTHVEEWSSSEIANFMLVSNVVDVDNDGKAEIIFQTSNYSDSTSYVYVYGYSGPKEEDRYQMKTKLPIVHQNKPNPFSLKILIDYELPSPGDVKIELLNSAGQIIDVINIGEQPAGKHTIEWKSIDHRKLTSGVCFYRLIVDGKRSKESKKAILLR